MPLPDGDIVIHAEAFQIMVGYPLIALAVFGLAIADGWLWSVIERCKAVEAAYDEIREQVTRERSKMDRR